MAYSKIVAGGAAAGANPVGIACGPDPDGVGIDCVSGVLARTYVGVPGRPASLPRPKLLDHRALSRDLRGRPPTGVLNRFGGGVPKYAANPGLTANFRRSLPEIGCLSQGLPHGKRCAWPCPPRTVKHPLHRPWLAASRLWQGLVMIGQNLRMTIRSRTDSEVKS